MDDPLETFTCIILVIYHLIFIFINNHNGQLVIDSSLNMFNEM